MGLRKDAEWPMVRSEVHLKAFDDALATPECVGLEIIGPPGMGKSRLADECLAKAARAGHQIRRAVATGVGFNVPFGAVGHLAGELADPKPSISPFIAPGQVGSPRPREVLFIDDLPLLDEASSRLLSQVVATGRVFLLATAIRSDRQGESESTPWLDREPHTIALKELSEPETAQTMRLVLGGPVGRRTVRAFHDASNGTLLYLRELVSGSLESGALRNLGEIWDLDPSRPLITPRLAELIRSRVIRTSHEREVVELLAAAGSVGLEDAIESITKADRSNLDLYNDALTAISELEASGSVAVVHSNRRRYVKLLHPLHASALQTTMPQLRRRQLLLEQTARVQQKGGNRHLDHFDMARWSLAATGTARAQVLVSGASEAFRTHDSATALTLLAALPQHEHTRSTRLILAQILLNLGQHRQALDIIQGEPCMPDDTKMRESLWVKLLCHLASGGASDAQKAINSARYLARRPEAQAALRVYEGCIRSATGDPESGLELLSELPGIPAVGLSRGAWLTGSLLKASGLAFTGRTAEATSLAERVIAYSRIPGCRTSPIPPDAYMLGLLIAYTEAGRLDLARAAGEQGVVGILGSPLPVLPALALTSLHLGRLELIAGHLVQARAWYAEAIAHAERCALTVPLHLARSGLAAAAAQMGDPDAARAVSAQAALPSSMLSAHLTGEEDLGRAWIHAAEGRITTARTGLAQAAAQARACGHRASEAMILTDLARLGEDTSARLSQLASSSDSELLLVRARAARALATRDADALMTAADDCRRIGADLLAAELATAAADAYQRQSLAQRATGAAAQARRWSESCSGARTLGLAQPEATSMLTGRELEIALLVSSGASNRDAAQQLNLSVRTVENHVQRVFAKLGVTRRRQLAQALGR